MHIFLTLVLFHLVVTILLIGRIWINKSESDFDIIDIPIVFFLVPPLSAIFEKIYGPYEYSGPAIFIYLRWLVYAFWEILLLLVPVYCMMQLIASRKFKQISNPFIRCGNMMLERHEDFRQWGMIDYYCSSCHRTSRVKLTDSSPPVGTTRACSRLVMAPATKSFAESSLGKIYSLKNPLGPEVDIHARID